MKNLFRFLPVLFLVLLSGCTSEKYEIVLTPKDGKVERQVTYSRKNQGIGLEVKRLEAEYDATHLRIGNSARLEKVFGERMPDDVGGHGSYKRWNSPMGNIELYLERFRGSHDYATQLSLRRDAVDDFADLLVDWLTVEIGHETGFDDVEKFLENDFRNELHNLSIGIWQTGFETDSKRPEFWFRVAQFLLERDYVQLDQIPTVVRDFQENKFPPVLLENLRKRLINEFPLQKIGNKATEFFATEAKIKKSFNKYIDGSELVAGVLLPKWRENLNGQSRPKRILTGEIAGAAFWPSSLPFFSSTQVAVKLKSMREPLLSNGRWNQKSGSINWAQSIGEREEQDLLENRIPGFAFSVVATPDLKYQTTHFGKEVLNGEKLSAYVFWYNGLTKDEQANLDKFIGGFDDSTRRVTELTNFRKRTESDFAGEGVDQLIQALKNPRARKK